MQNTISQPVKEIQFLRDLKMLIRDKASLKSTRGEGTTSSPFSSAHL